MAKLMLKPTTDEIVVAGLFSAISALFQVIHIGIPTPLFIWIDLVGVSWIMAYFLKGFKTALLTALISTILIAFIDPVTGILGASMKFIATMPMILVPAIFFHGENIRKNLSDMHIAIASLIAAVSVRAFVTVVLNAYIAIPIFFGRSLKVVAAGATKGFSDIAILLGLNSISSTLLSFSTSDTILFALSMIAILNTIIGVVEFSVAWYLSFKTGIGKLDWS